MGFDLDKGILFFTLVLFIIIPMTVIIFSLLVTVRQNNKILDEYMVKEAVKEINN